MNILAIDRVEHLLGIEHHASTVAGPVIDCAADHHACSPPGAPDHHPVSHSHAGDTAGVKLTAAVEFPTISLVAGDLVRADIAIGASAEPYTLERPPKT